MTALPDELREAIDELEDATIDVADCGIEMMPRKHSARARIDELLAGYVEDRKRLDFWQQMGCNMKIRPAFIGCEWHVVVPGRSVYGNTLREAIDSARSAT